jgi:predicted Fe-Mo cluster-binding NifX family protein
MEIIALTSWGTIISPLYDASCNLMIVRPDGQRLITDVRDLSLPDRAQLCIKEGVQVLICGAISNEAYTILKENGVNVLSWICGSVDELIIAYQKNEDIASSYSMPGCRQIKCRNQKGQGRKCGRLK